MKPESFESRLEVNWGNDIILTTDGRSLVLHVESQTGRRLFTALTPAMAHELKAMIVNWEKLYLSGCFQD